MKNDLLSSRKLYPPLCKDLEEFGINTSTDLGSQAITGLLDLSIF